mgnify:CR=1 FL=1
MDTTLTLNGSLGSALANDERVQISLDGGNTWTDATVTNQRWSYTDTRDLADGDYTYQVRIIDQAGKRGLNLIAGGDGGYHAANHRGHRGELYRWRR